MTDIDISVIITGLIALAIALRISINFIEKEDKESEQMEIWANYAREQSDCYYRIGKTMEKKQRNRRCCSYCHRKLPTDSEFCAGCGAPTD